MYRMTNSERQEAQNESDAQKTAELNDPNIQKEKKLDNVFRSDTRIGRNLLGKSDDEQEYDEMNAHIFNGYVPSKKNQSSGSSTRIRNDFNESKRTRHKMPYNKAYEDSVIKKVREQLVVGEELEQVVLPDNVTYFDLFGIAGCKDRKITNFKQKTGCRLSFSRNKTNDIVLISGKPERMPLAIKEVGIEAEKFQSGTFKEANESIVQKRMVDLQASSNYVNPEYQKDFIEESKIGRRRRKRDTSGWGSTEDEAKKFEKSVKSRWEAQTGWKAGEVIKSNGKDIYQREYDKKQNSKEKEKERYEEWNKQATKRVEEMNSQEEPSWFAKPDETISIVPKHSKGNIFAPVPKNAPKNKNASNQKAININMSKERIMEYFEKYSGKLLTVDANCPNYPFMSESMRKNETKDKPYYKNHWPNNCVIMIHNLAESETRASLIKRIGCSSLAVHMCKEFNFITKKFVPTNCAFAIARTNHYWLGIGSIGQKYMWIHGKKHFFFKN